ncbi:hypothetical protein [Clostridium pasteurianum]|uniref:Uncharacterized protein n=1 Tax=Clostridium pasteurianum BC1 TaxID=86416 RepID=R4K6M9_CLOPA|nr:hypothetical protein [Clostridium pasteurianum]AGK95300.1 hypothetical protein Clopa_0234 [Clostridium pasteurianum BC1]
MNKESLELAKQKIDEALITVETMEKDFDSKIISDKNVKEQFVFLSEKVQQLEEILKQEGIL